MKLSLGLQLCGIMAFGFCCQKQARAQVSGDTREIPFVLANGFLIEFEGAIGTSTGLKFILDTGATHSIVDRNLARDLGVLPHTKRLFDFDRYVDAGLGVFPEVLIGPVHATNVPLLVGDLQKLSPFASTAVAIIGADLLSLADFAVDYDKRVLSFHQQDGQSSSANHHETGMIVELEVQGRRINVLVDTGTEGMFLFENRLKLQIPHLILYDDPTEVLVGSRLAGRRVTLPDVQLGSKTLEGKAILVKGPPSDVLPGIDGYLGTAALKPHRIEFNHTHNLFSWR
ncbi:MAG TPA: aspartyl protease family protein [Terriglobales bacterium]|nr:aspartyl protease family protein [Terriglobales bacterium]